MAELVVDLEDALLSQERMNKKNKRKAQSPEGSYVPTE